MSYESVDKDAHEEESLRTFGKALELGINLIDTAWIYQALNWSVEITTSKLIAQFFDTQAPKPDGSDTYKNEELVGKAIKKFGRDKFIICTKFGITKDRGVSLQEWFLIVYLLI